MMNGVIEGGTRVMLLRSGFGGREEEWQVGDYLVGFIVIAVLLKNTETFYLAFSSTPQATEHIGPYTLGRMRTQRGWTDSV